MSWQMPSQGQWPGAVAMTPDMMNMGTYTPDQWAAMQQNWQQWAQWQQQYAQWQTQYGEKYAQQMQVMASAPQPPPAPPAAPPPANPPPPPAPPPPHENNQPLFAPAAPAPTLPAPVPPPSASAAHTASAARASNPSNLTSVNITPGNAHSQWPPDAKDQRSASDAEALRKLAEEEKLFDIQFQKWEEEIDKWRKENVNHPDKDAYKEYEAKFEACRAQLLERRQQMKQRRACLLSSAPAGPASGNKPPAVPPPPVKKAAGSSYNQHQGYNDRQDYRNQPPSHLRKPDQEYPNQNPPYHQFNKPPPSGRYNRENRGSIDPQDRYESYEGVDNYSENDYPPDNSSFLPTSGNAKGIPGLDLVPETDKTSAIIQEDVIEIPDEHNSERNQQPRGPDYSTISKGINNILGDEKLMNILSSLQGGQNSAEGNNTQNSSYNNYNNQNVAPNNQWNRNDNYNNQQYNNRPNNMPYNNRQDLNNPMQQNQSMQQNHPMHHNHPMQQNQPTHHNQPMQSNHPMQQNYPMQQNRPGQQNHPGQQNKENQNRYPPNQRRMYEEQEDSGQDMFYNRNSQHGGSNMPQRNDQGQRHNAGGPRPLLELPVQPPNNFQQGPPNRGMHQNIPQNTPPPPPQRPKWVEEPLFTPSFIVEYEHKPLRLKARDFIEPVHMFDYHHKSKDGDIKKRDFEKEADEIFTRKPRRDRENEHPADRFDYSERHRDLYPRDSGAYVERRVPRDDIREDYRSRPMRDDFEARRRPDDRYDDRRRDDRDKYSRRDDVFRDQRERDRERDRDRHSRDNNRRDDNRYSSRSQDREVRKRDHSRDSQTLDTGSKKSRDSPGVEVVFDQPKHVVMIDDILESPGREMRPEKIVIILRGPPGSGKSYLAKLIRDREAEYGGTVRIMSIDDYFMQEGEIEEKDPTTGKIVKKPTLKYEYDEKQEEVYLSSLKRAFKRSLTDGYFTFLIYDAVNDHLKSYADVWNFARQSNFQVYVCTMELDPQICYKRNIHGRTLDDIQVLCSRFFPTPGHHIQLDATTLLQSAAIPDVHMEDADDVLIMEDAQEPEVESVFTSKWESMDDAAQLAKLDGTSKPLRPSQLSMEDYLQLDDWTPNKAKPGKKSVRWADIEERRQQEKMRAIGFVVGQTDWNRMTDPTMGSSALTQTKYIERVRRT